MSSLTQIHPSLKHWQIVLIGKQDYMMAGKLYIQLVILNLLRIQIFKTKRHMNPRFREHVARRSRQLFIVNISLFK